MPKAQHTRLTLHALAGQLERGVRHHQRGAENSQRIARRNAPYATISGMLVAGLSKPTAPATANAPAVNASAPFRNQTARGILPQCGHDVAVGETEPPQSLHFESGMDFSVMTSSRCVANEAY